MEMELQAAGHVIHRGQRRPDIRDLEAVVFTQGAEGEAVAHFFLVYRVDVVGVAGIDCDRNTRMGHALRRYLLGFPHLGPGSVTRRVLAVHVRRQADDVKRKIALAEQLPPIGDHGREELAVLVGALGIGLALIPDRAGERERSDRRQHTVVQNAHHARHAFVSGRQRLRRVAVHGDLALPLAG